MKNFVLLLALLVSACAAQKQVKVATDPTPKFANSRDYSQSPNELIPVVEEILTKYISESSPATDTSFKRDGNRAATGWVYGTSRDKYLVFSFNGSPKRKYFRVRHKFAFTTSPSVAGTLVNAEIEEEVEELDVKTGEAKGWKSVSPDRALYQKMFSDLDLAVRSR